MAGWETTEAYSEKRIWCSWFPSSVQLCRIVVKDATWCYLLSQMIAYAFGSPLFHNSPGEKEISLGCLNKLLPSSQTHWGCISQHTTLPYFSCLLMPMGTESQALVSHFNTPVPQMGEILSECIYESFCQVLNTSDLLDFNSTLFWQVHHKKKLGDIYWQNYL